MTREDIEKKMHESAEEIKPLVTTLVEALCEAQQKGYLAGVELGVKMAYPHWIPVEERLPKFDEQVLVYGLCPNGCRLFYVDCLIQDINDNGYPKWDDDTIIPTHWMPLPEAPQGKEDEI